MTDNDIRALNLLAVQQALVGPQHFGTLLWPDRRYRGSNCSAPYARPAGKVLNRLKRLGFAEWAHEGSSWDWRVTLAGRRFIYECANGAA